MHNLIEVTRESCGGRTVLAGTALVVSERYNWLCIGHSDKLRLIERPEVKRTGSTHPVRGKAPALGRGYKVLGAYAPT